MSVVSDTGSSPTINPCGAVRCVTITLHPDASPDLAHVRADHVQLTLTPVSHPISTDIYPIPLQTLSKCRAAGVARRIHLSPAHLKCRQRQPSQEGAANFLPQKPSTQFS